MEKTLSVFFGNDRTYVSVVKPTRNGVVLEHIDSTRLPLSFLEVDDDFREASAELSSLLKDLAPQTSQISAVFSIDNAFVHQFPASSTASMEELQELLKLEIRQQLPGYTLDDFQTEAFPMAARLDGTEMMLAISIEKNFVMLAEQLFGELQIPLAHTGVSQLAAHSALMYNYPEHAKNTVMVLGVQDQYMDVSVVRQGMLAYYNLVSLPSKDEIGQVCEREMQKLLSEYVPFIDAAFLFGSGLTKPMLDDAQRMIPLQVERLNTFRMMKSALNERARQYSSRVAHIFPACIGGAFPPLQEGIKII